MAVETWPKPRPKPKWKQAEDYFKQTRDGKIKVTLARVSILEQALEEEAA